MMGIGALDWVRTGQTFGRAVVVLVRDVVVRRWAVVSCGRPEGSKHAYSAHSPVCGH